MDTGKTKDGLKSWKDMVQLKVMLELHPVPKEGDMHFPKGGQSSYWVFS
jgi:hypothetical protein